LKSKTIAKTSKMDEPMLNKLEYFFQNRNHQDSKIIFFQNYQNIFNIVEIQFGSRVHMNQSFENICQNVKKEI
jgi:hypothetical protein